jgi:hypothetical protein
LRNVIAAQQLQVFDLGLAGGNRRLLRVDDEKGPSKPVNGEELSTLQ